MYNDPMDNLFWECNKKIHDMNKPRITAEIIRRKKLLHDHWTILATEYMVHHEKFKLETKGEEKDEEEADDEEENNNNSTLQSTRSTRNGRPRRTGAGSGFYLGGGTSGELARTEYEQELILRDMVEREALERRIKFGGSAIPRQIGKLERVSLL
jgi:hypothetical protein